MGPGMMMRWDVLPATPQMAFIAAAHVYIHLYPAVLVSLHPTAVCRFTASR